MPGLGGRSRVGGPFGFCSGGRSLPWKGPPNGARWSAAIDAPTAKLNHYGLVVRKRSAPVRTSAGLAHRLAGGGRTGGGTEAVERLPQFLGDVLRVAAFDVRALEHENQLPVTQQGD